MAVLLGVSRWGQHNTTHLSLTMLSTGLYWTSEPVSTAGTGLVTVHYWILYKVLKCFLQGGHCVPWVYIIIIIPVVYYYLSSLLAKDWHFEICLSPDNVKKKNKLLLFQKSINSRHMILWAPTLPRPFPLLPLSCVGLNWVVLSKTPHLTWIS